MSFLDSHENEKDNIRHFQERQNAVERFQQIQDELNHFPSSLLLNHLNLPSPELIAQQLQNQRTHSSKLKMRKGKHKNLSLSNSQKPPPVLSLNMQESMNKIRSALTPLDSQSQLDISLQQQATSGTQQQTSGMRIPSTAASTTRQQFFKTANGTSNSFHKHHAHYHPFSNQFSQTNELKRALDLNVTFTNDSKENYNQNRLFTKKQARGNAWIPEQFQVKPPYSASNTRTYGKTVHVQQQQQYTCKSQQGHRRSFSQFNENPRNISSSSQASLRSQISSNIFRFDAAQASHIAGEQVQQRQIHSSPKTLDISSQFPTSFLDQSLPPRPRTTNFKRRTNIISLNKIIKERKNTLNIEFLPQSRKGKDLKEDRVRSKKQSENNQNNRSHSRNSSDPIKRILTSSSSDVFDAEIRPAPRDSPRRHGVIDMRQVNPNLEVLHPFAKENLPVWIRKRPDFLRLYVQSNLSKKLTLPKICLKLEEERSMEDLKVIEDYLQQLKVFEGMNTDVLRHFSLKLKAQIYWKGERIYNFGDQIDRMMIVFEGKLLSRKGPFEEEKIIAENEIIFREALKQQFISQADYQSESQCVLLFIEKEDYNQLISVLTESFIANLRIDIRFLPLFKDFSKEILNNVCDAFKGELFFKGEKVYSLDQPSTNFFLIAFGEIRCENVYYIDIKNAWPKGNYGKLSDKDYHDYRIFQRILKNERILSTGQFFGDQELIYQVGRMASTVAWNSSFLLRLSKDQFYQIFSASEFNSFIQYREKEPITLEKNFKSLERSKINKETRTRLIDAMSLAIDSATPKYKREKIADKLLILQSYIKKKDFNKHTEKDSDQSEDNSKKEQTKK